MAEPQTIKGIVAQIWDKEKSSGKGCFTIVKLGHDDTAYFDFSGKANAAGIKEGDDVEITYSSNGNTKLLSIAKTKEVKQTELPQETPKPKTETSPQEPEVDAQSWRIARSVALKLVAENVPGKDVLAVFSSPESFVITDVFAEYIATGKHPDVPKPKKGKK